MSSSKKNATRSKTNGPRNTRKKKEPPVKKVWVEKKKKEQVDTAQVMLRSAGGSGTNIEDSALAAPPVGETDVVRGESPNMAVEVEVLGSSIAYCALGIVLRAIRNGWLQNTEAEAPVCVQYYAWVYLYNALSSAFTGTIPLLSFAPLWFWELAYAIKPKIESFKVGKVAYSCAISPADQGLDPLFQIQLGGLGPVIFFGSPTTSTVNGFPVLQAPVPYTDDLGTASISSLFNFLQGQGLGIKTGDPGENGATMAHDTSAFAAVFSELGTSPFSAGGLALTTYSERFIQAPIFSKFTGYQEFELFRGWHEFRHNAGGACYIGPRLSELPNKKKLFNKVAPIFKFYNFDEYFDQFSYYIGGLMENASQSNLFGSIIPYPLTSQQARLMLRQALLPVFANDMGMDIAFFNSSDVALVDFFPFSVGPNGYVSTTTSSQPLFPTFFAEGARAAHRILAKLKGTGTKFNGVETSGNMILDIVPILGCTSSTAFPSQYTWTNADSEAVSPVYVQNGAEVPIDIVSVSSQVGQNTFFLDLNGAQLAMIIGLHNTWIQKYSSVSTGLMTISGERGITALSTSDITLLGQLLNAPEATTNSLPKPVPVPIGKIIHKGKIEEPPVVTTTTTPKIEKKMSTHRLDASKDAFKIGAAVEVVSAIMVIPSTDNYMDRVAMSKYVCNMPQIAAAWKYKNQMVCPLFLTLQGGIDGSASLYMAQQSEPWSISMSSVTSVAPNFVQGNPLWQTLSVKHQQAAALDLKAAAAQSTSEMERDFATLAAQGRGGLFTRVAAGLANVFGWKEGADIANTIGDITGF